MTLLMTDQRALLRIEAGLLAADPELGAMLELFGRLTAGQSMPAWEQVPSRTNRVRAAAPVVLGLVVAAIALGLMVSGCVIAGFIGSDRTSGRWTCEQL